MAVALTVAARADVAGPAWNVADSGAVQAEWTDWSGFINGFSYSADTWEATDLAGNDNDPAIYATDPEDAFGGNFSNYSVVDDALVISANNDFSLWVPTFAGQDVLEVEVQVAYLDDPADAGWRQGWDLSVDVPIGSTGVVGPVVFIEEDHDIPSEVITEVYGFTVSGNSPSGVFIDFNADPILSTSEAYVDRIQVDGISYNIPEPGVLSLLLIGGVSVLRRRKAS